MEVIKAVLKVVEYAWYFVIGGLLFYATVWYFLYGSYIRWKEAGTEYNAQEIANWFMKWLVIGVIFVFLWILEALSKCF